MKPDREFEDEFMTELKEAIGSRNATLDEVARLIDRTAGKIWVTREQADFGRHLIQIITALKTPDRL